MERVEPPLPAALPNDPSAILNLPSSSGLLVREVILHVNIFLGNAFKQHMWMSHAPGRADSRSIAISSQVAVHLFDKALQPRDHFRMFSGYIGPLADICVQVIEARLLEACPRRWAKAFACCLPCDG